MVRQETIIGLIVAAFVATIAFPFGPETKAADGRYVVIEIRSFEFTPNAPVVEPGDVIVWINRDIVPHTVTSRDESWSSGTIETGDEWKTVITANMLQDYFCRFHPSMIGSLNIQSE